MLFIHHKKKKPPEGGFLIVLLSSDQLRLAYQATMRNEESFAVVLVLRRLRRTPFESLPQVPS